MKKIISFVANSFLAGFFISVGCAVNLSAPSQIVGAFLFSLGLFAIITFKLGLYTGKAGYIVSNPPKYLIEVVITFLGNALGTFCGAFLLNLTRFGASLSEKAATVFSAKASDNYLSIFVLSVFCGLLMFTAVEGNRRLSDEKNFLGALFITVMPVAVFIVCGFNHSVADMAYFFLGAGSSSSLFLPYIILAFLGNAVGCCLLPLIKKLTIQ